MSTETFRPFVSPIRATVIGGLLTAIASVSMALYTPAMPALIAAFGTDMAMIKSSLTAYFAGFALAQLVCGPLSDAYGRRPIAFAFLALYTAAGAVATFAGTVEVLIAARLVQGIGAAVGVAISRAVVRDLFTGQESARVMNAIGIVLSVGPAISPTIGGLLSEAFGWWSVFVAMTVFGAAALASVFFALPETNRTPDPALARPDRVLATYRRLIADRRFLAPVAAIAFSVGPVYSLGTMLPFVLIDRVGLTPTAFGIGMLGQTGSFFVGGLVARRAMAAVAADRLVLPALILSFLGATATLAIGPLWPATYLSVMIPVGIFAFSMALVIPALTTAALAPFAEVAGSASALMGFLQMGAGFLGGLAATLFADPVTGLKVVFPTMLAGALAAGVWRRGIGRGGSAGRHD
ncbi:MAG: multidrug effflux MFS transporter [Siculibacillus sp.]|nr:multidrug effflux MFS transporter [Siculibacillus sp.]